MSSVYTPLHNEDHGKSIQMRVSVDLLRVDEEIHQTASMDVTAWSPTILVFGYPLL